MFAARIISCAWRNQHQEEHLHQPRCKHGACNRITARLQNATNQFFFPSIISHRMKSVNHSLLRSENMHYLTVIFHSSMGKSVRIATDKQLRAEGGFEQVISDNFSNRILFLDVGSKSGKWHLFKVCLRREEYSVRGRQFETVGFSNPTRECAA